jgi:cell wall assembly regulator SMI1
MAKQAPRPLLFVFPLPPEAERSLLPSSSGTLAYYHDRPLLLEVPRAIGQEPALDEATRSLVFDAIEARIEELGLEERLYRDSTSKKRLDCRGFVTGTTMEAVKAACDRMGWTLIRPLEEPDEAPPPPRKPEAKPAKAKARKKPAAPAPEIPAAIAAEIAKIEKLAKERGVALSAGASFDAILALEEKVGVELPIDVRAFYLAHDGGSETEWAFGDRFLLSLDGIATYWEACTEAYESELDEDVEADRGVRKKWWSRKWIPVTHDAGGNHHVVDLAPTKSGKLGQIVSYYHDNGERTLEGSDFLGWLAEQLAEKR